MKKKLALLLAIVMVVSMFPLTTFAAATKPNVTISVDKTEVSVGDTITVKLGIKAMTASSVAFGLYFDKDLLEVTTLTTRNCKLTYEAYDADAEEYYDEIATPTAISTKNEMNESGRFGVAFANANEVPYYEGTALVTIKFTALANGTVEFLMFEDSAGTDGYKDKWTAEQTVTIGTSAPSCDHTGKTYTYTANGNDTHKVTCECGEVVEAAVTCSGGTATCTAKAKCDDCDTEYGSALGHKDVDPKDHVCDNGCEVAQGEHKSNAQYPCLDGTCEYCNETIAATASHTDVDGEDHTCDVCGTENVTNHTAGEPVVTTTPSTCTEGGSVVTETFCTKCGERLTYNSESIPAGSACELGEPAYTWADDYTSCTAEVKCQSGTVHKSETVNTTSEITTFGTCTEKEVTTYTADFTADWAVDQTKEVTGEKDPTSHAGEPSYEYVDESFHKVTCSACGVEVYEPHDWYSEYCPCGRCLIRVYFCDVSDDPDDEPGTDWMTLYAHCGTDFEDTRKLYPLNGYEKIGFRYWNLDTGESYEARDIEYLTIPAKYVTAYYNALLEEDTYQIMMQVFAYADLFIDLNGGSLTEDAPEYWADYYDPDKNVINDIWASNLASSSLENYGEIMVRDGYELTGFYDSTNDKHYTLDDRFYGNGNQDTTLVAQWQCLHSTTTAVDNGDTHNVVCGTCGEVSESNVPHTYDETTHECVCRANIHNFVNVIKHVEPTCTEEGYTIYACGCGAEERKAIDAFNHFPTQYNKNDGTHYAKCCVCTETLGDPEPHTYDETTHMCACGDVENFYLTVYDLDGNPLLNTLVPYGDGIYDYVKDLVCDPVRVETEDEIGYIVFNGWVDGDMNPIDENDTMPAEKLNVWVDFVFTGWIKYGYNDGWVYEVMNQIQKTGWTEIDGAWYYLNPETGIRAEGMTRVPYPTVKIDGNTYEADAETLAYCQSKDKTFIDAAEAWFNFDEDGKFQSDMTGIVAHPVVENANSYVVNGMLTWHPGLVNPGAYLYFTGDAANGGNILATGDVYVTRNNTSRNVTIGGVYTFGADGKLCEYNGVTNVNGVLRYYQNAQLMLGYGLVETENGFVFVRSNGAVAIGKYYLTNVSNYDGDALKYGDGVTFGADGYALNGIVDGKYYINGKVAYGAGVVQIEDGKFIYVRSNGEIVTNRSYWITNVGDSGLVATQYTFDENGIMQDPEFVADQLNGIHNGYYYKDGKIVYGAGLIEIEKGVYIYVRSNGQLATGEYWPTNTNDLLPSGKYDFGTDGKLYI